MVPQHMEAEPIQLLHEQVSKSAQVPATLLHTEDEFARIPKQVGI